MVAEPTPSTPVNPATHITPQSPLVPRIKPETQTTSTPSPKTTTPSNSPMDKILSSLEGKNYPPEQIDLLKKVFSTMLVVCSSSQKKSVIQLMEIAVNSLK